MEARFDIAAVDVSSHVAAADIGAVLGRLVTFGRSYLEIAAVKGTGDHASADQRTIGLESHHGRHVGMVDDQIYDEDQNRLETQELQTV